MSASNLYGFTAGGLPFKYAPNNISPVHSTFNNAPPVRSGAGRGLMGLSSLARRSLKFRNTSPPPPLPNNEIDSESDSSVSIPSPILSSTSCPDQYQSPYYTQPLYPSQQLPEYKHQHRKQSTSVPPQLGRGKYIPTYKYSITTSEPTLIIGQRSRKLYAQLPAQSHIFADSTTTATPTPVQQSVQFQVPPPPPQEFQHPSSSSHQRQKPTFSSYKNDP
jgi:hypothetical protein